MSKTVIRFTPVSGYDLPGLERWLGRLAARGLRFSMTAGVFTLFERTQPRQVVIHLECARVKTDREDEELSALYREAGWEYWGIFRKNFHVFSAPVQGDAPAHTDPEVLGYAIGRFLRQKLLGGLGRAALAAGRYFAVATDGAFGNRSFALQQFPAGRALASAAQSAAGIALECLLQLAAAWSGRGGAAD